MPSSKAFCIASSLAASSFDMAGPPAAPALPSVRSICSLAPSVIRMSALGFADAILRGGDRPTAGLEADLDVLTLLVGRDLEAAGAAVLGLEDDRGPFDDLVGRVDDLALDHARRLGERRGRPRPPERPAARACSAATSPTASRLPPHCRFRALRAHREHTPVVLTLRASARAAGRARPTAGCSVGRWRFVLPSERTPRDPEAMLRSARFAAAYASGDDSSEDERSRRPTATCRPPATPPPMCGSRAPSCSSRTTRWSGTSSGSCSSSRATRCSRPRTATTR